MWTSLGQPSWSDYPRVMLRQRPVGQAWMGWGTKLKVEIKPMPVEMKEQAVTNESVFYACKTWVVDCIQFYTIYIKIYIFILYIYIHVKHFAASLSRVLCLKLWDALVSSHTLVNISNSPDSTMQVFCCFGEHFKTSNPTNSELVIHPHPLGFWVSGPGSERFGLRVAGSVLRKQPAPVFSWPHPQKWPKREPNRSKHCHASKKRANMVDARSSEKSE